jgi:uncharacterized damage-inducible protein DinB
MPTFVEVFQPNFEAEMNKTRTMLQAVPDADPDFKPHEKSMTLGKLAGHVAGLASWIAMVLNLDTLEMTEAEPRTLPTLEKGGHAALMKVFEENVALSRSALEAHKDADLSKHWQFTYKSHKVLDLPKTVAIVDVCLNHMVHHRGQLSVYLRLLNAKVPGLYGPSADEK